MSEEKALARVENPESVALMQISDVKFRVDAVQELMRSVMKEGPQGDYGVIPGTGDKKTLLKPGAEKLCTLFRLAPTYTKEYVNLDKGHRECILTCTLTHIPTGVVWGQGVGSCSTMESKYRWRGGARLCPECGKPAIKKSKYPPRGAPNGTPPGFYCFAKIGGCSAEFAPTDPKIVGQSEERQENPDIADSWNTVLKMATKRALVAAVLIVTGASSLFTQDMDDALGDDPDATPANTGAQAPAKQPAAGKPAAAPAPTPAPTNGIQKGEFTDRVATIIEKSFKRAGKTDGVFWEVATSNGTKMATFSATIHDAAEAAMAEEAEVVFVWEDKGRGKNLTDILQTPENAQAYQGEVVA